MAYYVVRVKWLKDGTKKKSELMEYSTKNEAVAKYHSNLGSDMVDDTLSGSMCDVIGPFGEAVVSDYWGHETVVNNAEGEEQ